MAAAAARLLFSSSSSSTTAAAAIAGAFAVTGGSAYTAHRVTVVEDDDSNAANNRRRRLSTGIRHCYHGATAATTTRCEAAAATTTKQQQQQQQLPGINLRSRMTAIGHFSILSETVHNPSICTFVMTLSGKTSNNDKPAAAAAAAAAAVGGSAAVGTGGTTSVGFSARDFCTLWKERDMAARHPRFHLRASETHPGHFESTTSTSSFKTDDDTDDTDPVELHVSEGLPLQSPHRRADILQRICQMQTQPWSLHEKLWHVDIIPWKNSASSLWRLAGGTSSASSIKQQEQGSESSSSSSSSVILFRGHHVLADGASMGAALMDLSDEAPEYRKEIQAFVEHRRRKQQRLSYWQRLWQRFKLYIWLCTGSIQALMYQTKLAWYNLFWNADPWGMVKKAYDDDQLVSKKARRVVADFKATTGNKLDDNETAAAAAADLRSVSYITMAPLEQAKWIAETLSIKDNDFISNNNNKNKTTNSKITINDLFVTAITAAVMRQLKEHRQRLDAIASYPDDESSLPLPELKENKQKSLIPQQDRIHVSVPVHLKGGVVLPGESVGNNIGAFTVQLPGEATSSASTATSLTPPVQRLFAVHQELNKVKQTPAPLLSNMLARTAVAFLPRSWTSYLFQRASAGSTCVITNVRGPSSRPMHMQGRTVESIYGFVPLPPGIPMGVVVSSYAGQMLLTVTAERWAVPNADLFLSWVVEEYLVLLQEASRVAVAAAAAKRNKNHQPPNVAS